MTFFNMACGFAFGSLCMLNPNRRLGAATLLLGVVLMFGAAYATHLKCAP